MKYLIIARYGAMASLGYFVARSNEFRHLELLIINTPRGTEIGEFLAVKKELAPTLKEANDGTVIAKASDEEVARQKKIQATNQKEEMRFCEDKIEERSLKMRLKYVEHILGGERIIFYFTAEERVDFRDLVKDLAEKYKTRIEMKQIGARDEAHLLEDCGICGQELCCRLVLRKIEPVSMKMAKLQTSTLDPAKVSGRCGRLKCCFRYENPTYKELKSQLPHLGDIVKTAEIEGEVINLEILTQRVLIAPRQGDITEVPVEDIIEVIKR